ncbi:MAG: 5-formyltetrahydrofolate cyclo-ligase [Acidobacteriota bacterium]|nr:5-formyltetrahydrofolate cyclo-ligase [Acidobacteriota bacterium]
MTKSELRKIYLAKQKQLSPNQRNEKSRKIADLLLQNFDLTQINFLHCFLPIEKFNEIDTKIIFEKIWRKFPNIKTFVPRINFQTNEIQNLVFTSETELVQNAWQIHEPTDDQTIETEKIDACLVPLLCFDRRGFRVGYGKGFYDRFLKNCRADCLKIGLSYFAPVAEISDAQRFDIKLDFCVTPKRVVNINNKT